MKVANAEQMKRLDREAVREYRIPGIVLMENASLGVIRSMETKYGRLWGRSVLIFCGKGNNGGDGMASARHLANRGAHVQVVLLGEPESLQEDAAANYAICERMKIRIHPVVSPKDFSSVSRWISKADLILDAILGTGIVPPVRGLVEQAVRRINRSGKPVISVDLPTGLSADSSEIVGEVVHADLTVTFGLPKISLVQYPSLSNAGEVHVADISLPWELVDQAEIPVELLGEEILQALPPRRPDLHKGEAGRVLLIAGSRGMPGAAVMAALSCFRSGAGLVYAAVPGRVREFFHKQLVEGITVTLPETERDHLSLSALPDILAAARGKKAAVIGPGIGLDPATGDMVRSLIQKIRIPMILDADALSHLAGNTALLRKIRIPVILTPHPGEMARLTDVSDKVLKTRRVDLAREFAAAFGVILVLKGARTVIADPKGRVWINPTGNPGMATAGTGDVLTGMIAGLAAQGMAPLQAALAGVFLHGRCGDRAAAHRGKRGLLARDLIREIPNVLRTVDDKKRTR